MDISPRLQYIYSFYIDLLKFAETKHVAIIVLNASLVAATAANFKTLSSTIPPIILFLITFFSVISLGISLYTQLPSPKHNTSHNPTRNNTNIYYYKDVASMSSAEFEDQFSDITGVTFHAADKLLIEQIIEMCRICDFKFEKFKLSCLFTILSVALMALGLLAFIAK